MSLFWRLAIAIAIIVVLATLGQNLFWFGYLYRPSLWPDVTYLRALGPEVGGSGFSAIIVGAIAGYVSAQISRESERRLRAVQLALRRRLDLTVTLDEEFKRRLTRLPLWGFAFSSQEVKDATIEGAQFGARKRGQTAATLTRVAFKECVFRKVDFGGAVPSTLIDTTFSSCALKRCSFKGVQITSSEEGFSKSMLDHCKFDGATLVNVSFDSTTLTGCSFWGATLDNTALPLPLYTHLKSMGAITPHGSRRPGHEVVVSRANYVRLWLIGRLGLARRMTLQQNRSSGS